MKRKEKISVKTQYFLLGVFVGTFLIPKITKSAFGCNNGSTNGSYNGNTIFLTLKKEECDK